MDNKLFQAINWAAIKKSVHPGKTGLAFSQCVIYSGLQMRLVEYSKNYLADNWFQKGHIVYCLEGDFECELQNGDKVKLLEDMTYIVSDNSGSLRTRSANGVKLLIIDGGSPKPDMPDLMQSQMNALHAQMNPHFIFNALNSIDSLILDNETTDASKYLSQFALMIRLTLDHSRKAVASLDETVKYLHAYLGMEQLRFRSSFSYLIETPGKKESEQIHIPTLMIQPLAENAIWHGLMHKNGGRVIIIRFVQANNVVTCTIEDNGIGINQSKKMNKALKRPQAGLNNLLNRIEIMNEKYGMNCSLEITDIGEQDIHKTGTLAVLQFKVSDTIKNEYLCGL